jgi:hypothetical protein
MVQISDFAYSPPSRQLSGRQQMVGFALSASINVLGEKLHTDLWISQSACCELCQEPFFLGAVTLLNYIDDYVNDCCALTT